MINWQCLLEVTHTKHLKEMGARNIVNFKHFENKLIFKKARFVMGTYLSIS
jgi:hypothetical protein